MCASIPLSSEPTSARAYSFARLGWAARFPGVAAPRASEASEMAEMADVKSIARVVRCCQRARQRLGEVDSLVDGKVEGQGEEEEREGKLE